MKYIFGAILWFLLMQTGFAQSNKDTAGKNNISMNHKLGIGGSFGYGLPLEGYGTSILGTVYGEYIGYAEPGPHFDINFQYLIIKHWGILLESGENINYINPDRLQSVSPTIGYYYFGEYLAGPFYSKDLSNGNIFESWLAGGIINLYGKIDKAALKYSSNGWGAEAGVKFKKHITKGIYITFDVAFTQAQANKNVASISYLNYYGAMGLLVGGVGVELRF